MRKDISCIIVDDEIQNQVVLEKLIDRFCPTVEVKGSASSVMEAVPMIEESTPDIVFLDIEMPEENGFKLFERIKNPKFSVIFTTAHAEYALKAIKYAAMDYLLKPINLTELKTGIEKVIEKITNQEVSHKEFKTKIQVLNDNHSSHSIDFEKIALPTKEGITMYSLENLIWCQAQKGQTLFHMENGEKILVSELLKEYESLLPSSKFCRIHKSHIVNLSHVEKYLSGSGGKVLMSNGIQLEVAVRRKKVILEILKQKFTTPKES
jgi:two-component system, LytTR family, response regulator